VVDHARGDFICSQEQPQAPSMELGDAPSVAGQPDDDFGRHLWAPQSATDTVRLAPQVATRNGGLRQSTDEFRDRYARASRTVELSRPNKKRPENGGGGDFSDAVVRGPAEALLLFAITAIPRARGVPEELDWGRC